MEKRNPRNGRSLETLGYYDPMVDDPIKRVHIKVDRVQHWLDRGARPSATVTSFLRKTDVTWGNSKKSRKSAHRKRRQAKKKSG